MKISNFLKMTFSRKDQNCQNKTKTWVKPFKLDWLPMQISLEKCKCDTKFIFWKRENFVFALFLNPVFFPGISFSNLLENEISMRNSGFKKSAKTKFSRFKKIKFVSNLHFFDEIFLENEYIIRLMVCFCKPSVKRRC